MAWIQTTASNYKDCLDIVRQFTQKAFAAGAITPGGGNTGDGTVYGASATHNSVAETWTLTASSATVFTVSGSVSGAQASATVGEPYSITEVSFIIGAGDAAFIATDSFTFPIAISTAEWVQDRWDTDYDGSGGYELIQHGIGAGSDEIFVGYNTKTDDSTYWNWLITGLTGYVPANDMILQPAYSPYYDCLNNASLSFTCIFTSRHIKVIPTTVTGEQGGSYNGWFLPHSTPSQWTYPMFTGGSTDLESEIAGSTADRHTGYWNAFDDESSGAVLDSSVWHSITKISPRNFCGGNSAENQFAHFRPYQDDKMPLFAALPVNIVDGKVYGELEGVYYPSAFTPDPATLSAGSTIISDGIAGLCFKDVFRGFAGSIVTMDLMGD